MQITKEEFNLKNPTEARKLLLELYNVGRKLAKLKENIDSNNVKKMRELLVEVQRLCSYTGLKKGGEGGGGNKSSENTPSRGNSRSRGNTTMSLTGISEVEAFETKEAKRFTSGNWSF